MDLKYYDNDANGGKGEWVSLKATNNIAANNNDSAFTTPKYIIENLVKEDGNFIKYYDGTILNKKIKLDNNVEEGRAFVSKIELLDDKNGTITLKPSYNKIQTENEGNFVSNVFFDDDNNLKITKADIRKDVLSPVSSGTAIPDDDTTGFFYLQVEKEEESNNDGSSA